MRPVTRNSKAPDLGRLDAAEQADVTAALTALQNRPASHLADHGHHCCRKARAWLHATARAMACLDGVMPRWIRERWDWGPHEWPLSWCQIIEREEIDCGAFAALTREALLAIGCRRAAVQLIERFDTSTVENWSARWDGESCTSWLFGRVCFHEAVGLVCPSESSPQRTALRVWDPVDTCWVEDRQAEGYGSVAACRILPTEAAKGDLPVEYDWRGHVLEVGCWHILAQAPETPNLERTTWQGKESNRRQRLVKGLPGRRAEYVGW